MIEVERLLSGYVSASSALGRSKFELIGPSVEHSAWLANCSSYDYFLKAMYEPTVLNFVDGYQYDKALICTFDTHIVIDAETGLLCADSYPGDVVTLSRRAVVSVQAGARQWMTNLHMQSTETLLGDSKLFVLNLTNPPKRLPAAATIRIFDREVATVCRPTLMIPGHQCVGAYGPKPSRVMVIGKWPWIEELSEQRHFVGESGRLWKKELAERGIVFDSWYITNVCRFKPVHEIKAMPSKYLVESLPFLICEIAIVRPELIVCMGADAARAVLGEKSKLDNVRGEIRDIELVDIRGDKFTTRVIATIHPAQIPNDPASIGGFRMDMDLVASHVQPDSVNARQSIATHYQVVEYDNDLQSLVSDLISAQRKCIAVDCEWAGTDPSMGPDHYLRSIQIAWDVGCAAYLKLHDVDGKAFLSHQAVGTSLNALLGQDGARFVGHNIRSDLPWLDRICDSRILWKAVENGFDTMLAHHVLDENGPHGLNDLAVRMTDLGRYDRQMNDWLSEHPPGQHDGFKDVPDELLVDYALKDADACYRLFLLFSDMLEREHADRLKAPVFMRDDGYPSTLKTLYLRTEFAATPSIYEMERTGMRVDISRLDQLSRIYAGARDLILNEIRTAIKWSDFNYRSVDHVRALLFQNVDYKNKKPSIAPDGAVIFDTMPVKSTSDKPWARVVEDGDELTESPSTDADTLAILSSRYNFPVLNRLRQLRMVDQICKNFLPLPNTNENGEETWDSGLRGAVWPDGCIHTRLSQLAETGRYRSSGPNMQNIPKRQVKELNAILASVGFKDVPTIRSCFVAGPGWIMLEADYSQAELVVMAYYSGDQNMIEILADPSRDLHLETANKMFGLGLQLTGIDTHRLRELKDEYATERVKAKVINFGVPYGMGSTGLQMNLAAEGVRVSEGECQEYLNAHAATYSRLHQFLNWVASHVSHPPYYFESVWGRRRRFHYLSDRRSIGDQEREAKNFPIQETVADALTESLARLNRARKEHPDIEFKMILSIHDANMFLVRPRCVRQFIQQLLRPCMSFPLPGLKVALDVSIELCLRWGEHASADELVAAGMLLDDLNF